MKLTLDSLSQAAQFAYLLGYTANALEWKDEELAILYCVAGADHPYTIAACSGVEKLSVLREEEARMGMVESWYDPYKTLFEFPILLEKVTAEEINDLAGEVKVAAEDITELWGKGTVEEIKKMAERIKVDTEEMTKT